MRTILWFIVGVFIGSLITGCSTGRQLRLGEEVSISNGFYQGCRGQVVYYNNDTKLYTVQAFCPVNGNMVPMVLEANSSQL